MKTNCNWLLVLAVVALSIGLVGALSARDRGDCPFPSNEVSTITLPPLPRDINIDRVVTFDYGENGVIVGYIDTDGAPGMIQYTEHGIFRWRFGDK